MIRKERMISFRLTHEEYEQMQTLRDAYGARTVSDLARLAVHSLVTYPAATPIQGLNVLDRLRVVEVKVSNLNAEIDRLRDALPVKP
jgi:hypothetical protein